MSTGYYCNVCRNLQTDPETRIEHEVDREPGKATVQLDYEVYECADCGSSDLVEVDLCELCLSDGVITEADTDEGLCHPHQAEEDQCMAEHAYDIRMGK